MQSNGTFFFCCLCLWYHVQEVIAKSNVMKILPMLSSMSVVALKTTAQVQSSRPPTPRLPPLRPIPPTRSQLCCRVLSLFEVRTMKSLGFLLTVGTCDIRVYWSSRPLVCVVQHAGYEAKVVGQSALFFSVTFLFFKFQNLS